MPPVFGAAEAPPSGFARRLRLPPKGATNHVMYNMDKSTSRFTHIIHTGLKLPCNRAKSNRFNPVLPKATTRFLRLGDCLGSCGGVAAPSRRGRSPTSGGGWSPQPVGSARCARSFGGRLHNRYRSVAFAPPASGGAKPFYLMSRDSLRSVALGAPLCSTLIS